MVAARRSQDVFGLPRLHVHLLFPFHLETGAGPLRLTSNASIPGTPSFIPPVIPTFPGQSMYPIVLLLLVRTVLFKTIS